jgi:hypothetical protein
MVADIKGGTLVLRVFDIGVLRRVFGTKRDEVAEEWRKFHNEELNDLNSSPNIVLAIKSRRMGGARHVARMGKREAYTAFLRKNLRERDHWGSPGIDGRIISRWTFKKWVMGVWNGLSWVRIETGGGHLRMW